MTQYNGRPAWARGGILQFMALALFLLLCLAAPATTQAANLVAEYEFNGTLTDRLGNSTLTAFGATNDGYNRNNIESGFLEDVYGTYWYWKSSLARGGGFWIDVTPNIRTNYSVGVRFSFQQTNGYRKIIDYQNSTSDNGFYIYNGRLDFYPVGTGTTGITNNQLVDLVATRDSTGTFKAYFVVNGVVKTPPELNVSAGAYGMPILVNGKPRLGFFFDDTATSSEATTGGKVYGIKIWDSALTAAEIQQAMNPRGTVADVAIIGATGVEIVPKDVVVTLLDDSITNAIAQDTVLTDWISNIPAGLAAKAKTTIPVGATNFTLRVSGTPTAKLSAPIQILIPASALTKKMNLAVAENPDAAFGISPYKVVYNGNAHTSGSVPVDTNNYALGDSVTVLGNTGGLAKSNYIFRGWNTRADGSGTAYTTNDVFTIGAYDVTLYAAWTPSNTPPPTVTTQPAISITETSAVVRGTITSLGSPNPTAHGFCWGTNLNPTIYNGAFTNRGAASSPGAFTNTLTGLTPGVTYYVRAYAANTGGTSYGTNEVFTTLSLVTSNATYACGPGISLKIRIADIAWDLTQRPISMVSAGPSAQGAALSWNGTYLFYLPANNSNDSFSYTVGNGNQTKSGTITVNVASQMGGIPKTIAVSGGNATIQFFGIPGTAYDVQRTTSLTEPVTWTTLNSNPLSPGTDGSFSFTDSSPPPNTAYYRSVQR